MSWESITSKQPHRVAVLLELSTDNFATIPYAYGSASHVGDGARIVSAGDLLLVTGQNHLAATPDMSIDLDNTDGALSVWADDLSFLGGVRARVSLVADDLAGDEAVLEIGRFVVRDEWPVHKQNLVTLQLVELSALAALPRLPTYEDLRNAAADAAYYNSGVAWAQEEDGSSNPRNPFAESVFPSSLDLSREIPLQFGADFQSPGKYAFERETSNLDINTILLPLFCTIHDPRSDDEYPDRFELRAQAVLAVNDANPVGIVNIPRQNVAVGDGFVVEPAWGVGVVEVEKDGITYWVAYIRAYPSTFRIRLGSGVSENPTTPNGEDTVPYSSLLQSYGFGQASYILSRTYSDLTEWQAVFRIVDLFVSSTIGSGTAELRGSLAEVLEDVLGYVDPSFTVDAASAAAITAAVPFGQVSLQLRSEQELSAILTSIAAPFDVLVWRNGAEFVLGSPRTYSGTASALAREEAHVSQMALPSIGEIFAPFSRVSFEREPLSELYAWEFSDDDRRRLGDSVGIPEPVDTTSGALEGRDQPRTVDLGAVSVDSLAATAKMCSALYVDGLERIEFAAAPRFIGADLFGFVSGDFFVSGEWRSLTVFVAGKQIDLDGLTCIVTGYVVSTVASEYQMINETTRQISDAALSGATQFRCDGSGNLIIQTGEAPLSVVPVGSLVSLLPTTGSSITSAIATMGGVGKRNWGIYSVNVTWSLVGGEWALQLIHQEDSVLPEAFATSGLTYVWGVNVFLWQTPAAVAPRGAVCNALEEYNFDGSPAIPMTQG